MVKSRSTFRRTLRKAGRAVKSRYFKGKGFSKPKLSRMAKDLAVVKSMVNAEKEIYVAQQLVGQNVDVTTPYFEPLTNVAEGTTHGTRDGESVKLHGYRYSLRFGQQASGSNTLYCKLWIVKYIGPRGSAPAISTFLKPDFDGNYSTYSKRNEDHYGSYIVVARKNIFIPADTVSGVSMYKQTKLYGRFKGNCHQRYSGALQGTLLTDQMYFMAVSSDGTIGTSTANTITSQLQISFYDN